MAVNYNATIVRDGLVLLLDSTNPKSYSPNVFRDPLDTFAWFGPYGAYQMTGLARDTVTGRSPAGGIPFTFTTAGTDGPYLGSYNSLATNVTTAAAGQTWNVSFWVKSSVAVAGNIFIFGANSSGNYIELGNPSFNSTTSWTRVNGSYTMTNANTVSLQVRLDCYVNGVQLWIDGMQIERASTPTSFNSITNTNGVNWFDVSGRGNNATLFNGPTFPQPYLNFNGVNQFARTTNTLDLSQCASVTVEIGFRVNSTSAASGMAFEHGADWNTQSMGFGLVPNSNGGTVYTANSHHTNQVNGHGALNYTGDFGTNLVVHTNTWSKFTSSTGRIAYINAVQRAVSATANYPNFRNDFFFISARNGSSIFANQQVHFIRVYNRAITPQEVQDNFNAVRGRYLF